LPWKPNSQLLQPPWFRFLCAMVRVLNTHCSVSAIPNPNRVQDEMLRARGPDEGRNLMRGSLVQGRLVHSQLSGHSQTHFEFLVCPYHCTFICLFIHSFIQSKKYLNFTLCYSLC
jgi:hypothetical protein